MSSMRKLMSVGLLLAIFASSNVMAQENSPANHWDDFIHYIRVAQFKLAAASGQALLDANLTPDQLLNVVEKSIYARNKSWEKTLLRAQFVTSDTDPESAKALAEMAKQVENAINQSRKAVIRDPKRIRQAIERLAQGQRAKINATRLLKEAGEYAAPELVNVLISRESSDRKLRPYVLEAMTDVGLPLVAPLCQALPNLPAVVQQQVSIVLGEIGYPLALPYLKALADNPGIDAATAKKVTQAYLNIATRVKVSQSANAANLFLKLGEDYYSNKASLTLEPSATTNLMWQSDNQGLLTYLRIPTPIYKDVMAMRSAKRALTLNKDLSNALSLWVSANFRRENNLAGQKDPSYGPSMRSPLYYANLAGPRHVLPVLARALEARDAELALDAIRSLNATTGNSSLTEAQPLIAAMNYPDRRVRFESAFTIAQALPTEDFVGGGRVVPVLASAVRQGDRPVVLVIADNNDMINTLADKVRQTGQYTILAGTAIDTAGNQLENVPGIDLLVISTSVEQTKTAYDTARSNYKMKASPMVVLSSAKDLSVFNRTFADDKTVKVTPTAAESDMFASAVNQALGSVLGKKVTPEQATAYATYALHLLRDAAVTGSKVLEVKLAQSALIEALRDNRKQIVHLSAQVLALIDSEQAQQAIAEIALDNNVDEALRISLFKSLANSAKRFGAKVTPHQNSVISQLVTKLNGTLADSVAEAHGALNMPTATAVIQLDQ